MKTNEAPEKIWVHELSAKELNVPLKEYHIEYTRTDAFIKKATRYLNRRLYDRVEVVNFGTTLESIILKEEFIDDFKNYMKGE